MKGQRIVYIISDVDKALAFEWATVFLKSRYDLSFILIGMEGTALEKYLANNDVDFHVVSDRLYPGYISKWFKVYRLLLQIKPTVVHTHLWRANLIGLTASWILRIKKRVFTRHHAMVHYIEHPSGRKWDRLCNILATDIIAISGNVREILIEHDGASPEKIHLLHHGFDLAYFENVEPDRVSLLREKYHLSFKTKPVIGVIARYMDWKGIQYVIPAFQNVVRKYSDAHLVLANAAGPYRENIRNLLSSLPENSYTEIPFEADLSALYRLFDIYVHVPVDEHAEAFGQTYVESLLCKVPSVFTNSGVAREFIKNGVHARVVPFRDANAIEEEILTLLGDWNLRERLSHEGYLAATSFSLERHFDTLLKIYH